jgi:predicted kinase
MEGIIFMGVQGSGKSTFYQRNFFNSHFRISLDLFGTRNKEQHFLNKCLELHQRLVIDNTNPTKADRARYIQQFQKAKFSPVGYIFHSTVEEALLRNEKRKGKQRVPDIAIRATYSKFEYPSLEEGFEKLYFIRLVDNDFVIEKWKSNNEI